MQRGGRVEGADGQDDRAEHDGHRLQEPQHAVDAQVEVSRSESCGVS